MHLCSRTKGGFPHLCRSLQFCTRALDCFLHLCISASLHVCTRTLGSFLHLCTRTQGKGRRHAVPCGIPCRDEENRAHRLAALATDYDASALRQPGKPLADKWRL